MRKMIAFGIFLGAVLLIARTGLTQDLEWSTVLKSIRTSYPEVTQISTDSLSTILSTTPAPVLLDVRTASEYRISHIGNAVNISPDESDFSMLDSLDRDSPIVAYCSVGFRSSALADRLADAGFTNVSNLEGSIFKWANEGRVVVSGDAEGKVHPYNKIWGRLLEKERRADADAVDN